MTTIVVVAMVTLLASFACSLLEAALYSVTPSQLDVLRRQGAFGAKRFAYFRAHIDGPIAAILTINTVAHTVGATVLGALVENEFGSLWLGLFTIVFTLAVLLLTEIVPKSIGVKYGRNLIPVLVWPLQLFIWISWPIAKTCSWLMKWLTGSSIHMPTEDEIIAMSKAAGRHGELTELETRWVENVLLLDRVTARDIMTPRTVVQFVAADDRLGDVQMRANALVHSRLPVVRVPGDLDTIVGVIHRRDIQTAVARGEDDSTVDGYKRSLEAVPENMPGPQLLEKFILGRKHMVMVCDEYGGFEGIVTLEDVIETMLGSEIVDEHDVHVDMQELARRQARRPQ